LTVLIYLGNFEPGLAAEPRVSLVLFPVYLFFAGLVMTGICYQDMHHPLERYQYLMLPCSNFERFLCRYLLTGPVLLLYVAVTFMAMDWVGNQVAGQVKDAREPLFSMFSAAVWLNVRIYLLLHVVALTGAICCRSYALLKTVLALLVLLVGLMASAYLAARIFYWDYFSWMHFAPLEKPGKMQLMPLFDASWLNVSVVVGFVVWILYAGYRCLCAHEVQDEL
jgi:hypothetical protein